MRTKSIALSLGIAVLLAGNMSSVADASWLSKAMDRLETSNAKLSPSWPKADQYRHYRPGQVIGAYLPAEDMKIAGVSLGTSFDAVKASLGQPTSEKRDELTYGRPDFIDFNNRWFYGYLRYNSDNIRGIFFEHNGSKVTKIIISDN